ncbi:MAG: bifunctional phosphopantothenoylcysteine decarboxylase/phosphopantothenate--cysteine ligase CoaBC [Xanthobacteraceae bacterium]
MASLTIRNLSDSVKQRLKMRAAANNRSMEEEIRHILADVRQDNPNMPEILQALQSELRERLPVPKPLSVSSALASRRVLLIITGGIVAYKALDLIRRLRERGAAVRVVMTKAAQEFVTPLSASALAGGHVFTDLFDAKSEFDVGHIRLARDTDVVVVAPCSADFLARMVHGLADDLAGAVLLATERPVLIAPAMNPHMWNSAATQRNLAQARADGIHVIGPNAGEMAESGEAGIGRMAEPTEIADAVAALLTSAAPKLLAGKRVLITAGPTHEPIDPVRYIANRSSGKQGYAIARAAADAGAHVTLISGPVNLPDPAGVAVKRVESAREMLNAVEKALPADIAIFAGAVADWRVAHEGTHKIKKGASEIPPLALTENPDILSTVAHRSSGRPKLVIGFAAETENVVANAQAKLARKGCDWILANDVSAESGVMGGDHNTIHLVTAKGFEDWPEQSKEDVARMLVSAIAKEIS